MSGKNGEVDANEAQNGNEAGANGNDASKQSDNGAAGSNASTGNDAGNDNGAGSGSNSGSGGSDAVSSNSGEKMLSQSEVNKIAAKEKNQGRNAVYNELGIDPSDTKMINLIKSITGSQKEEDGDNGSAAADNAEMQELRRQAALAEAKAEAMMQGVKPQFVDDAVVLAMNNMTEGGDFKTVIGELKTKYPAWFSIDGEDDGNANAGKKGTGSSMKSHSDAAGDGKDNIGARLAAQRKGAGKKSSFWGN